MSRLSTIVRRLFTVAAEQRSAARPSSVDSDEISKFARASYDWWNPSGQFAMLHKMNGPRMEYIRAMVDRHLPANETRPAFRPLEGLKVLDVGCGGGLLSESLSRLGAAVTGIDAAPENVAMAAWHSKSDPFLNQPNYIATTAEDLLADVGEGSFDVVCALEIVEHVKDAKDFIGTCVGLVKPGGLAMVSTINRTPAARVFTVYMAENVLSWVPKGTHDPAKYVTPSELTNYIEQAGAKMVDTTGIGLEVKRRLDRGLRELVFADTMHPDATDGVAEVQMGDVDSSEWGVVEAEEAEARRGRPTTLAGMMPPQPRANGRSQQNGGGGGDGDPLGALGSDNRESLAHAADDEDDRARPVIHLRSNGARDALRDHGGGNKRASSLFDITIDEMELAEAPQILIQQAMEDLEALREDVTRYTGRGLDGPGSDARNRKVEELLVAIARETSLYDQFVNASSSKLLTLENILSDIGSDNGLHAADDIVSISPRGPPTDTMSDGSNRHPKPVSPLRSRRTSISSLESGPSKNNSLGTGPEMGASVAGGAVVVPPGPHDVFRWTHLRALSDSLLSDSMTQKVGMPTVFTVSGCIVVGTSRSMLLVYDFTQSLQVILGEFSIAAEYGAVTSVAISPNHHRIVCGYAQGVITIWDIRKKAIVRQISPQPRTRTAGAKDGHLRGAAIIHIAFINGNSEVVSADNEVPVSSGSRLFIIRVRDQGVQDKKAELDFIFSGEWMGTEVIVSLQWMNDQGSDQVEVASPLTWSDRVTALVRSGNFKDAIVMATGFFSGDIHRAAIGIPSDTATRHRILGEYIGSLLLTYVSMCLSNIEQTLVDIEDDRDVLIDLVKTCLETCTTIDRLDLLFGEIYDRLHTVNHHDILFEALEPYILQERITALANPAIFQALVIHYRDKMWLDRIEQIIIHLDPSTMDLHLVLSVCREFGLFSALIYIYNRTIKDFVTPIVDLLQMIETSLTASPDAIENASAIPLQSRCYSLYVYLAYVLTGKAFPTGSLTRKESLRAKSDIYNFLFSSSHTSWPPDDSGGGTELTMGYAPYPYVRLLFRYDASELLKVLSLAFNEPSLDGDIRVRDGFAADGKVRFADQYSAMNRQSILDSLLMICESEPPPGVSQTHLVAVYTFLARMYAKHTSSLSYPDDLLDKVFDTLTAVDDPASHDDRQLVLLGLLPLYEEEKSEYVGLLAKWEAAGFWRLCEYVHREGRQYERVLECYIRDPTRKRECFRCLRELLTTEELTYAETCKVKDSFMRNLRELVEIDPRETAVLVMGVFPGENMEVIAALEATPTHLFLYLGGLLEEPRDPRKKNVATYSPVLAKRLPGPLIQRYIEMLCDFEPARVHSYLVSLGEQFDREPYNVEEVLAICRRKDIVPAALWLLERTGSYSAAVDMVTSIMEDRLSKCHDIVAENADRIDVEPPIRAKLRAYFAEARESLAQGIGLCRRSLRKVEKDDRDTLWFRLVDLLIKRKTALASLLPAGSPTTGGLDDDFDNDAPPPTDGPDESEQALEHNNLRPLPTLFFTALSRLSRQLLDDVVGQVSAPTVLRRILRVTPARARFGEHRRLVFGMLSAHHHERELLLAAGRSLSRDVHMSSAKARRGRLRAVRSESGLCGVCRTGMLRKEEEGGDRCVLFRCRHVFHAKCLEGAIEAAIVVSGRVMGVTVSAVEGAKGLGWCLVCEAQHRNGVNAHKRKVLALLSKQKGKTVTDLADPEAINLTEALSKRLQSISAMYETIAHNRGIDIFEALKEPRLDHDADRIEMNDSTLLDEDDYDDNVGGGGYLDDLSPVRHGSGDLGGNSGLGPVLPILPEAVLSLTKQDSVRLELRPPPMIQPRS
ncbi:Vacuolar protein sorting-associated protein 8 [Irineochytrium annulatum]|nr:Vacuolar protein sorting-associated protein 8 [Irineochytrium annulatum]